MDDDADYTWSFVVDEVAHTMWCLTLVYIYEGPSAYVNLSHSRKPEDSLRIDSVKVTKFCLGRNKGVSFLLG